MPITTGYKQLIAQAREKITTLSIEEAALKINDPTATFIDIRDYRELIREGKIPNAFHAPRGMLEFWVDPQSPYFKPIFGEDKLFILYCQSAWRSSLSAATLKNMGLHNVAHIDFGFQGWKEAELPIEKIATSSNK